MKVEKRKSTERERGRGRKRNFSSVLSLSSHCSRFFLSLLLLLPFLFSCVTFSSTLLPFLETHVSPSLSPYSTAHPLPFPTYRQPSSYLHSSNFYPSLLWLPGRMSQRVSLPSSPFPLLLFLFPVPFFLPRQLLRPWGQGREKGEKTLPRLEVPNIFLLSEEENVRSTSIRLIFLLQ